MNKKKGKWTRKQRLKQEAGTLTKRKDGHILGHGQVKKKGHKEERSQT